MRKHKAIVFVLALAVLTGMAAWLHLSSREEVAEGTLKMTFADHVYAVDISKLRYEPVSGVRVNGKGEFLPVEGQGISLKDLLESEKIDSYSKVTVISDDSYHAELTAEEVAEEGRAYLMLQDEELRLIVFGDSNSKRSVSNVVQIVIE